MNNGIRLLFLAAIIYLAGELFFETFLDTLEGLLSRSVSPAPEVIDAQHS